MMSDLIPNNEMVIFDNASHFSAKDARQKYVDTLVEWIEAEFKALNTA